MSDWTVLAGYFPSFAYGFMRVLGALAFMPIEGMTGGWGVKFSLALLFAPLLIWPLTGEATTLSAQALLADFAVGMALGLPSALSVQALGALGDFIDSARGQNLSELYSPLNGTSAGVTSVLLQKYSFALLLLVGALELVIVQVVESQSLWRLGAVGSEALGNLGMHLVRMTVLSIWQFCQISFPFVVAFLAVDLCSIYILKLTPGINLIGEVFLAKSVLAFYGIYLLSLGNLAKDAWALQAWAERALGLSV